MENDLFPDEIMQESGSVGFTSFTDFVDENAVENLSKFWHRVVRAHKKHGLSVTLNQVERTITLSTTAETTYPHLIHKARACLVLAAQFDYPLSVAYLGIDNIRRCYEFIQTGYQDYGVAAMHGLDKEQYVIRSRRLFKHARVIAVMCRCELCMNEDCMLVSGRTLGDMKKFRSIVEKCILEDLDPTTLQGFGMSKIQRMMKVMKV